MKKTVLVFLSFFSTISSINSQTFTKVFTCEKLWGMNVFHDDAGFIYVTGYHAQDRWGAYYWNDSGATVFKIQKYDPNSEKMIWEQKLSSPNNLFTPLVTLENNKLLVGGAFKTKICNGANCFNAVGGFDTYLATISTGGNISIQTEGDTGDEKVCGFARDGNGNLYISGLATGQVKLGNTQYNTGGDKHFYLLRKNSAFTGNAWTITGKALPGEYVDPAWYLTCYNNFLYGMSGGRTKLDNVPDTFGCGGPCSIGNKWDLSGNYLGKTYAISEPTGGKELLHVDADSSEYYIEYCDWKGCDYHHFTKKLTNNTFTWRFGPPLLYGGGYEVNRGPTATFFKGNVMYMTGPVYDYTTNLNNFHIELADMTTGQMIKTNIIPTPSGHLDGFLKEYLGDDFILYGQFSNTVQIAGEVLYTPTLTSKGFVAFVSKSSLMGISEITQNPKSSFFTVCPNPSSGVFEIKVEDGIAGIPINISVKNLLGKTLIERQSPQERSRDERIDLSQFGPGIYFIELDFGSRKEVKKIVVN